MKKHIHNNKGKNGAENKGGNKEKIKGIINVTGKGVGYFESDKFEEDIEIPTQSLNTALNGDEVEIIISSMIKSQKGRVEGEVVKIIKRAKEKFVGVIDKGDNFCFLVPDDKKMYCDIFIPLNQVKKIKNGEKALVKIIQWDDPKKNPEGKILNILGKKGENDVEMRSIVYDRGFDIDFPNEVLKETEIIKEKERVIKNEEVSKRKDFRDRTTFTIDPDDAKDFDDAISFKKINDEKFEIGVHIADVSFFVRPFTELDKEAQKRSSSIYLVDRTIPMLPEILSNGICSLKPNEDRFTFSAVFEMNKNGKIEKSWFGKTIINSNRRFAYEEVQKILDNKKGEFFNELNELNCLAKILQKEKFEKGAIDFEQDEVKFNLDKDGRPISVYKKTRLDAHKLVEEYMLLANRAVAEFIYHIQKKRAGGLYRIHDIPNAEKIKNFSSFLKVFGYELEEKNGEILSKDINKLLKKIEGKPEESLIKTVSIRSMAKAIYSTKNIGHYGLAFEYYTHFTSPIRRYADLLVHRILEKHLNSEPITQSEISFYEKMAEKTTEKEIAVAGAERASIKYKQVEFMKDKVGEIFDGIISGVTDWGIYIEEINTKCEGMIRLRDLADDYYTFEQKKYALIGQKTRKKYTLGDKVKFKIARADLDSKTLDYILA